MTNLPHAIPNGPLQQNFDALKKGERALDSRVMVAEADIATLENPPRFRVYRNAALSGATGSAVAHDTEELDTHNWFAGGVYTPQQAGTYRFSWCTRANAALTADAFIVAYLAKNGTLTRAGQISYQRGATPAYSVGSAQLDANGTTDNFGIIFQHSNGGSLAIQVGLANIAFNFFDGEFIG